MSYRIGAVLVFVATLVVSWLLGGWVGYRQVEQESLEESFRYRQLVANELNRYLPVPELMAEHPLLERALTDPGNPDVILEANEQMLPYLRRSIASHLACHPGRAAAKSAGLSKCNAVDGRSRRPT